MPRKIKVPARARHVIDQEPVASADLDVGIRLHHFSEHLHALGHSEQTLLALILQHRDDQAVSQFAAARNQVQVSVGDRIERTRIDGDDS